MKKAGLAVELLETRPVSDAFKAMPVKSDRNDARNIAQLMRLGWFPPVHCKAATAQETPAILAARTLVHSKPRDLQNIPPRLLPPLRPTVRTQPHHHLSPRTQ